MAGTGVQPASLPVLITERLTLRKVTFMDVEPLLRIWGDPVAMQHYPNTLDREGMEAWIARNLKRYAETGVGIWAMLLKSSHELLGDCGLAWQEVEGVKELEIGYH